MRIAAGERTHVRCTVCDADANHEIAAVNGFRVVSCDRCGFVFVNPRPDEGQLAAIYRDRDANPYFAERYEPEELEEPVLRFVLSRIKRFVSGGNLLEIGCGRGDLLRRAERAGFTVTGCDFFGGNIPAAPGNTIRFFDGRLLDARLPSGEYDMVIARNVLEHLFDPRIELREIKRVLRPDGLLYVKVPSVRFEHGLACRLASGRSNVFTPPFHLSHFSRETFDRLLRQAGFAPLAWHLEPPSPRRSRPRTLIDQAAFRIFGALLWMTRGRFPTPTLGCIARAQ